MYYNVGDEIEVKNYTSKYNGRLGEIKNRNGEYFLVELRDGSMLQLYMCEMGRIECGVCST